MERAVPGRQEAVRPAVLDCKKAEQLGDRSSNRSNRTNRRAADRPRRVIDQAKLKPTNLPANTTTSKGAKASSRSYFSSSARPRSHNDPAATGHEQEHHTRTPRAPSFHRNVSSTVPSIRSSVVPAERHRTAGPRQPPTHLKSKSLVPSKRSTARSSRTPDGPIRSFQHDDSWRSSIRLHQACPHCAVGPKSRPADLRTPIASHHLHRNSRRRLGSFIHKRSCPSGLSRSSLNLR